MLETEDINKKTKVKGVSLIVLVITIIIMIILAATIILSISNTGIIEKAKQAKNDQIVSQTKEEFDVGITDNPDLTLDNLNSIKDSKDDYYIKNKKLIYIGTNIDIIKACNRNGITTRYSENSEIQKISNSDTAWTSNSWKSGNAFINLDSSIYFKANNSIKIYANDLNDITYKLPITTDGKSIYRISAMVKTDNVVGQGGSGLRVGFENVSNGAEVYSISTKGTKDWVYRTTGYIAKNNAATNNILKFRQGYYGDCFQGTAWMDDIAIEKIDSSKIENKPWKIVWFICKKIDAQYTYNGSKRHSVINMDEKDITEYRQLAQRFMDTFNGFLNGKGSVSVDVIEINTPINTLSNYGANDFFVSGGDFNDEMKNIIAGGNYDSILLNLRLGESLSNKIPVGPWAGLGGTFYTDEANSINIPFAEIRMYEDNRTWRWYEYNSQTNTNPENYPIHEYLHCIASYSANIGIAPINLHKPSPYGSLSDNDWYRQYTSGTLVNPNTGAIEGINTLVYRIGPSTNPNF